MQNESDKYIIIVVTDIGDVGFEVPNFKDVRYVHPDIKIVKV